MINGVARPTVTFLLRLWGETRGDDWEWRASLYDPCTLHLVGFPNPEAALAFIRKAMTAEQSRAERLRRLSADALPHRSVTEGEHP